MPRFAANLTTMFTEVEFLDRFAAARAAGFDAAEFLFPYAWPADEVAGAARTAGIAVVLFNFPAGDWASGARGPAALPGREAEFAAAVAHGLAYARTLGCPRVHAMAGIGGNAATYVANIRLAADRAAGAGVDVMIEAISAGAMPGYFVNDFAAARRLHAAIDRPNVRLQADLYHMQADGDAGDLAAAITAIGHVQIAGYPGRHEPDTAECRTLLRQLDTPAYIGHVGCEYHPLGTTLGGLGWLTQHGWQDHI